MQRRPLESLRAFDADTTGLKGAHASRNDHGTRVERRAGGRADMKTTALLARELQDFLPEVEGGVKRRDLLHQAIDELLGATDRKRRDVVNRFFRVQLGALPAGVLQGVHHMGGDPEQPQLEHLKQTTGAGPDDDHFGGDRLPGDRGRNFAQNSHFHGNGGPPL